LLVYCNFTKENYTVINVLEVHQKNFAVACLFFCQFKPTVDSNEQTDCFATLEVCGAITLCPAAAKKDQIAMQLPGEVEPLPCKMAWF